MNNENNDRPNLFRGPFGSLIAAALGLVAATTGTASAIGSDPDGSVPAEIADLLRFPRPGHVRIDATFHCPGTDVSDYAAAVEYCIRNGSTSEGNARFTWDGLLFADEAEMRHARTTKLIVQDDRLFADLREMSREGNLLRRYFWRDGEEVASTIDVIAAGGEPRTGALERWIASGNSHRDYPATTGMLVMDFAPFPELARHLGLAKLLESERGSATLSLADDSTRTLREMLANDGSYYGCATHAQSLAVSWETDDAYRTLDIGWLDERGNRILEQKVRWSVSGDLSHYALDIFLPGSDQVVSRREFALRRLPDRFDPSLLDIPIDRGVVRDLRFYEPVVYTTETGWSDEEVEQRSLQVALHDAIARDVAAGSPSPTVPLRPADGEVEPMKLHALGDPDSAPSIGVFPGRFDLPTVQVGRKCAFEFEVHNLTDRALVIDEIDADCGCIEREVSTRVIEPFAVARVTGQQEVQTPGYSVREIRLTVHVEDDPTRSETIALTIRASGTPRLYSGQGVFAAGDVTSGESQPCRIEAAHFGCATTEAPPLIHSNALGLRAGEWRVDGSFVRTEVEVTLGADVPAGAFAFPFQLSDTLCSGDPTSGVIFGNHVPPGVDEWPDCWVEMALAKSEASLTFPFEVTLADGAGARRPFEVIEGADGRTISFRLSTEDLGGLEPKGELFGVSLDSDAGPIRLRVLIVPR